MIEIKRLVDCTIQEGVDAWNFGFEGYYFDMTTTPEKFINRFFLDGLSPSLSIVAFQEHQPVGIVLNGIRELKGKRIAWNGGTGVASPLRSTGIGKLLMEATLSILEEENVDIATLEAVSNNKKAISLYEKMGFKIVDQLEYLKVTGALKTNGFTAFKDEYIIERAIPQQVANLAFYKGMNPWQTQWQNAKDGEALILKDSSAATIGYAYYRRAFNEEGKHITTVLYQCEAEQGHRYAEKIIRLLLNEVFASTSDEINFVVPNMPIEKSHITYSILKEMGFKSTTSQVYMMKQM